MKGKELRKEKIIQMHEKKKDEKGEDMKMARKGRRKGVNERRE